MAKSGNLTSKIVTALIAIAVLGGGGYYYLQQSREEKKPEIGTTTVTRGDIIQSVTATGQMNAVLTVDVGSQVSGLILTLHADFNTVVKKDQIIAELDPATYQQKLRQAQADLASSRASNNLQKLNTERTRELYNKQLVSKQELDQAEAQLAQADAALLTKQASVENAQVDLDRCTIRSPIDGIVISKETEEGKTVAASLNVPTLFTIANDLSQMEITTSVAEADIGQVAVGQDVTFTVDAFPSRSFAGKVKEVHYSPKTSSNVVTYETIIGTDNTDRKLLPGMTANVSIIVARRTSALRVANAALRARIPEGFTVKPLPERAAAAGTGASSNATVSTGADRPAGNGAAAGESGQRRGGRRGNQSDASAETPQRQGQRAESTTSSRRTVYKLPGGDKSATPEATSIRLGITDGFTTEILGGVDEGDVLVTSVTIPGQTTTTTQTTQTTSNPFQQQQQRGNRRG